jgi:LCP family protein required for cell wall assembly
VITPKRVILAIVGLVFGWLLLSFILFLISAQTGKGVGPEAEDALAGGGTLLTGSTILVLGSDEREVPGEEGQVGRADSIMLLHVGFGSVRRLSIPRDSHAVIPGHAEGKINSAYALGGAPLMIETVEQFMGNGVEVNHLVEVNFKNFPKLIDSLGGVTVDNPTDVKAALFDTAVSAPTGCAPGSGGQDKETPSEGFRIAKGECHLNGDQALTYARIRSNLADPGENDLDRAARQQAVLSGIRSQVVSPLTFFRLPWIAWEAPRAVRSDLKGPGLSLLFIDLLTGGTGKTRVLEPTGPTLGTSSDLDIPEEERARAADELLNG